MSKHPINMNCFLARFAILTGIALGLSQIAGAVDPLDDFVALLHLRETRNHTELIPACEIYLKNHPDSKSNDRVRYYLGYSLVQQKKYDEAIAALGELIAKYPESGMLTDAAMQRGEAFRNLGKLAESIPDFQTAWDGYRAKKSSESAAHAGFHLVQAHHAGNDLEKARTLVETMQKDYAEIDYTKRAERVINPAAAPPGIRPPAPPKPAPIAVGTEAPHIEFVKISDGTKQKLSDYKGKIVVLDFWASWCGPCQTPMAKMQTYREAHPDWGDQVELIALSIDNTREIAEAHLKAKGWDMTINVWAGEGGFRSAPPQAYRVSGIPTVYIIDAEGKVAATGHPSRLDIGQLVTDLLAKQL